MKSKAGFNFDEAIKKFSDNKLQENSNNLEWVGLDNFISDFRKQFENYPRENLIGPFKTELGWHIIKIYDYRKKDISDDVNRNNAKISIVQFKTELRFKDWLNALVEGSKIQYLEKIF
jgi:peptidyl-prolyl cis-trans isomerase SurA